MVKWQNTPHSNLIKDNISAESLLELHKLRESLV
jgi:hypothetical protein